MDFATGPCWLGWLTTRTWRGARASQSSTENDAKTLRRGARGWQPYFGDKSGCRPYGTSAIHYGIYSNIVLKLHVFIHLWALRPAYYVLLSGAFLSIGTMHLGLNTWQLAHCVLLVVWVSELLRYAGRLVYYRRAV